MKYVCWCITMCWEIMISDVNTCWYPWWNELMIRWYKDVDLIWCELYVDVIKRWCGDVLYNEVNYITMWYIYDGVDVMNVWRCGCDDDMTMLLVCNCRVV